MGERGAILSEYKSVPVQRVQGPFEILGDSKLRTVNTVRFADVAGAGMAVKLTTNIDSTIAGFTAHAWIIAEVSIFGYLQGFPTLLKIGQINRFTGPLLYNIPQDQPYDQIITKARNFSGGSPGISPGSPVTQASGAQMNIEIFFQPRLIGEFAHGKLGGVAL